MSSNADINEKELLAQLREGDALAFTRIYRQFWRPILLAAWNHTQDKDLAEDIVHEVFMKLWENCATLKIDSIGGFLATAVKFRIIRYYQKERNRQELVDQNLTIDYEHDGEAELNALFLSEYLDGLVDKLPERCQLVFRMSRDEGLKNSEIAVKLGITEKAVEANMTRALKLLRQAVDANAIIVLFHFM